MTEQSFESWLPLPKQTPLAYGKKLAGEGKRELDVRKALRFHFDMDINAVIALCAEFPSARLHEIELLRERFPDATLNRFAWRIQRTMTLSSDDAQTWAEKIVGSEPEASS